MMDCTNTFIYIGLIAIATFFKWNQGFIRLRNASVTSWVFDCWTSSEIQGKIGKKKAKPSQTFDEVCSVPVGVVLGGAAVSAAHADLPPGGQLHVRGPGLAPAAHSNISNIEQ